MPVPAGRPAAIVFDTYGTLLGVHAAVGRRAVPIGPQAAAASPHWRLRQPAWSWALSAMGGDEDVATVTPRAPDHAPAAMRAAGRIDGPGAVPALPAAAGAA